MFVKPFIKYNKSTKQRYNIYQLCESFRLDERVRHLTIIGLGKLGELAGEKQIKQLGKRIEELLNVQSTALPIGETAPEVEELAQYFCIHLTNQVLNWIQFRRIFEL
jgi:hypothetical protein